MEHRITKNITTRAPLIYEYLRSVGYSHEYSIHVSNLSKQLLELYDSGKIRSYEEYFYYLEGKIKHRSEHIIRFWKHQVRLIHDFVEYGRQRSLLESGFMSKRTEFELIASYGKVIAMIRNELQNKRKSSSYIETCLSNVSNFLYHLQTNGVKEVGNASEDIILGFFFDGVKCKYSIDYCQNIKRSLGFCHGKIKDIEHTISFLPKIRRNRKNIDYLKDEEIDALKNLLEEQPSRISLRDKAIITIGLYTGLRACDIANLTIDNIDWQQDQIRLIQSKTGNELRLPLRPVVGNAIFEYISQERAKNDDPHIFLSETSQHRPITRKVTYGLVKKAMRLANIRINGGRKGTHLLRHCVATSLLKNNVPTAIIATTLGHSNVESTNVYLSSDMAALKDFALSIEQFPVRKEVFDV